MLKFPFTLALAQNRDPSVVFRFGLDITNERTETFWSMHNFLQGAL